MASSEETNECNQIKKLFIYYLRLKESSFFFNGGLGFVIFLHQVSMKLFSLTFLGVCSTVLFLNVSDIDRFVTIILFSEAYDFFLLRFVE